MFRLSLLAFALRAVFPAQAAAQAGAAPAPANTNPAPTRVEVVGSSEQYDPRRDDTSTTIVVSQEEIRKYGDTTLADVLKRQPGISINGGGAGRGGEIRMRGLGGGYTQILLNGEPAPSGFSLDSLSPDLVEKIEIMRAGTAEFSARSIAGTINITLKRKVQSGKRDLKLRAEHSNVFFSPTAIFEVSDKKGSMSYTVGAEMRNGRFEQDYDNVEQAEDAAGRTVLLRRVARQNDGGFKSLSLTPRINWTLENGDTLTSQNFLRVQRSDSNTYGKWNAEIGGLPQFPIDRTRPEERRSQFRTDLSWVHKVSNDAKLETKFGLNANRTRGSLHEAGYDSLERQTLDRDERNDSDSTGATFTGKYSTRYGASHRVSAGWDAASQSTDTDNRVDTLQGLALQHSRDQQDFDARLNRLALYAQDEISVSQRLSVYLGLRWEGLRTRSAGSDYPAFRNESDVWSPIFQGLWKLPDSKQDQVRLAVTRTYRSPDLNRLIPRTTWSLNNTQVRPDLTGNPALKPELAWGVDAALERFGSNGSRGSVSAYARRITDYIHNETLFADGRWLSRPTNDGDARTYGLEFDAKFPLRTFVPSAPQIDVRFNGARNWSRVSNVPGPDNRLAGQTPVTASLGLDYRLGPMFSSGGSFTYKSGGDLRISDTTSTYVTVKRELDIYALWKLNPKTHLRLTAVNLLAEPATEITRYLDAGGSVRGTSVFHFSPIVRVALEMEL